MKITITDILNADRNTALQPWSVWLGWLERHPVTTRLCDRFQIRAHTQGAGSIPVWDMIAGWGENAIDASLTTMVPLSRTLSKKGSEEVSLGEDSRKKKKKKTALQ